MIETTRCRNGLQYYSVPNQENDAVPTDVEFKKRLEGGKQITHIEIGPETAREFEKMVEYTRPADDLTNDDLYAGGIAHNSTIVTDRNNNYLRLGDCIVASDSLEGNGVSYGDMYLNGTSIEELIEIMNSIEECEITYIIHSDEYGDIERTMEMEGCNIPEDEEHIYRSGIEAIKEAYNLQQIDSILADNGEVFEKRPSGEDNLVSVETCDEHLHISLFRNSDTNIGFARSEEEGEPLLVTQDGKVIEVFPCVSMLTEDNEGLEIQFDYSFTDDAIPDEDDVKKIFEPSGLLVCHQYCLKTGMYNSTLFSELSYRYDKSNQLINQ